jgi:hypothetical protein
MMEIVPGSDADDYVINVNREELMAIGECIFLARDTAELYREENADARDNTEENYNMLVGLNADFEEWRGGENDES